MLAVAHLLGLALTAGVALGTAVWVRRRTADHAGTVMVLLLLLHALMAAVLVPMVLVDSRPVDVAAAHLQFFLGLLAPALWLLLALYYTGRTHWLTRPIWVAVLGGPGLLAGLWLADPLHGWLVETYQYETEPFTYAYAEFTGVGFAALGLANTLTILAFGLFLRLFLFSRRDYRSEAAAVVLGLTLIFVASGLQQHPAVPASGFPYAVYGSFVFAALVAAGLFRAGTFAVLPLARDTVVEAIDDAILITDGEWRVVDYNRRARELVPELDGATEEPVADVCPALVGDERSTADESAAAAAAADSGVDSPFPDRVTIDADGSPRRMQVSVSDVAIGGEPRGYVVVLRDVTRLEEYATELEEKTETLERFASALSHDLRNPLAVARGYVESAAEDGDPALAEQALPALDRMEATIQNLLALSREGDVVDELEAVELRRAVREAWATTETDDAALRNEVAEGVTVRADPERLRTVLENLFRNAAEHGGETVRVRAGEDGFDVGDDGPGVPPEERDRVFDHGFTTGGSNTGLGLAIVEAIAEAHGWSVTVGQSDLGGALFRVRGVDVGRPVDDPLAT